MPARPKRTRPTESADHEQADRLDESTNNVLERVVRDSYQAMTALDFLVDVFDSCEPDPHEAPPHARALDLNSNHEGLTVLTQWLANQMQEIYSSLKWIEEQRAAHKPTTAATEGVQ